MADTLAYLNGQLLSQAELKLPLHDAGLVLGATVTDLCRTFRHRPFCLADHLARFRRSCDLARLPQPVPEMELTRIAEELVGHNASLLSPDQDLAIVFLATPGPIGFYAGLPAGSSPPTLAVHTFPLPFSRYAPLFREGARLAIPSRQSVPAACVDPRIKQRSRLHWWLAQQEVQQTDPAASALLADADGQVTETAAANFLLVRNGAVHTPPQGTVLGGISLQVTKELCAELGIPFAEQALSVDDCRTADEAMLSSTPYCLAGVSRINNTSLPWPGPLFEKLLAAWNRRVGLDVRRQICAGR